MHAAKHACAQDPVAERALGGAETAAMHGGGAHLSTAIGKEDRCSFLFWKNEIPEILDKTHLL
jgi:hypothetical protein